MTRLLLALCLVGAPALADRPHVTVVKSSQLGPYAQVVAGFSAEARAQVDEVTLEDGADAQATFKKVAQGKPSLVLAVGPAAAVGARRQFSDVPVLFVMVPYFEKYELEGSNTTGISLTSDLSLELTALKQVLPKAKRVGVVNDPRYSKKFVEDASAAAQNRGLSLVSLELDGVGKLDKVLSGAKGRIDALVVIADKTVGNSAVVERLLSFAAEEKLPVVGLAAAQVKQGALFALSPAPLALGLQAGRLANRVLVEKVDPGAIAVTPPEGLELHVNLSAAKKLGLPDSFALDVVSFAARQGLTVKPLE